jgi:hypothetical protein
MNMDTKFSFGAMTTPFRRLYRSAIGAALSLVAAAVLLGPSLVFAADVEAFEATGIVSGRPNVLFVLDSTNTLGAATTYPDFDPNETYETSAGCDPSYAYFSTADTKPGTCKTGRTIGSVLVSNLRCESTALDNLQQTGATPPSLQWLEKKVSNKGVVSWDPLAPSPAVGNLVYCSSYSGVDKPPPQLHGGAAHAVVGQLP